MALQIIWTLKAKEELIEIFSYWNERNKSITFSIKLNNLINQRLLLLANFPHIGRQTDISNVRVCVIHKYLLFYEIIGKSLFVLTISHGSKNPKTLGIK